MSIIFEITENTEPGMKRKIAKYFINEKKNYNLHFYLNDYRNFSFSFEIDFEI